MFIIAFQIFSYIVFALCNFHIKDEILFGISWKDEKLKTDSIGGITIHSKNKETYRCFMPSNIKDKNENINFGDYRGPSELELLKELYNNKICSIKVENYWTYEICHGRYVRQYHEETIDGKSSTMLEYNLGMVSPVEKFRDLETPNSPHSSSWEKGKSHKLPTVTINSVEFPYFKVTMTNGTKCDLIGQPRSISILYVCQENGKGEVYEIQEIRTCHYQAIIFTKLLCFHPGYEINYHFVNDILCYALNSSPTIPKSLSLLQDQIKEDRNVISTLDGLFNDNFNFGNQIKVEAFNENEIIVYRIKSVGKQNLDNLEENSEDVNEKRESETNVDKNQISNEDLKYPIKSNAIENTALLQKFLSGKFCVDGGEGWWRHRVCYNRKISQYHIEMNIETSEVVLGTWKEIEHLKWLKINPDKRPLANIDDRLEIHHYFGDGSYCDEIKANRETVLKIRCITDNSSGILISFLEPSICRYIVIIESALFCPMVKEADDYGLIKPKEE